MEELGRQAIEIISKIANGSCSGMTCGDCLLGYKRLDLCNEICRLDGNVEAHED